MPGSDITQSVFGGIVSAIDRRLVPDHAAFDSLNVTTEYGRAAHRPGWDEIGASPSGFTGTAHTLWHLRGSTSSASADELFTVVNRGSGYRPWSVDPTTGAYTEIKEQAVSVSLTGGEWQAIVFDGVAYAFLPGDEVYKHTVGDDDDFEAIDAARPANPASSSYAFTGYIAPAVDTPVSWAGAGGANLVYDNASGGGANRDTVFTSQVGTAYTVDLTNASGHPATYEMRLDLPGGPHDWSNKERIEFVLQWPSTDTDVLKLGFVGATMESGVGLRNADGSPIDIEMDVSASFSRVGSTYACYVVASFPAGATMTDWDNVDHLWLSLTLDTSVAGATTLTINQVYPYTSSAGTLTPSADAINVTLGIAAYDSVRDQESEGISESSQYQLDAGKKWFTATDDFLGTAGTATGPALAAPTDSYRLYVKTEAENSWRLVGTGDEASDDVVFDFGQDDILGFPIRVDKPANPVGNVSCACTYRGWVVWGKATGRQNVLHSAVGEPRRLARTSDDTEDLTRGAKFTLADDYADEPLWMGQAGRALIILGRLAAYSQTGDYPSSMTPVARLAQSKGLYGRHAACRFRDGIGNPGVAYVAKDLRVYFLTATQVDPDGEYGFRVAELGEQVRGEVKTFLGGGSAPDTDRIFMFADEATDSLWLTVGNKALRLSTKSLADGSRHYEKHQFTHGVGQSWRGFCQHPDHGIRAVRSNGAIDSIWRDGSGSEITGATRDNGSAPPAAYWQSKFFGGEDRRSVQTVRVERTTGTAVTVLVESDRANQTVTVGANHEHARAGWNVQGRDIGFKVTVPADGTEIVSVSLRQQYGLGRDTEK